MKKIKDSQIAVVGLGYVGLPLAVEFGKHFNTIGFDINQSRIKELKNGNDSTMEVSKDNLESSENLIFQMMLKILKIAIFLLLRFQLQ